MNINALYAKLIGGAILALVVGVFVASYIARGAKIERLENWQTTVVNAATAATVEPDKNGNRKSLTPESVPAAIAVLKQTADNAGAALASIDAAALKDKALQRKLDEQLTAILASQDESAAGAKARIADLLKRGTTGDKDKDCEVMAADSNAAWDGWRK